MGVDVNINLLPWREQRAEKIFRQFLLQIIVGVLLISLFFIFLHFLLLSHRHLQFAKQNMRFQQQTLTERKKFLSTLRIIINALPKNCYLTELTYHHQWIIAGQTTDIQALPDFLAHLKRHPQFHHIALTNVSSQKPFTYHVTIQ